MRSHDIVSRNDVAAVQNCDGPPQTHVPELPVVPCRSPRSKGVRHHPLSRMAFFDFPLADLLLDCEGAGPLNKYLTVLQNYFLVNLGCRAEPADPASASGRCLPALGNRPRAGCTRRAPLG